MKKIVRLSTALYKNIGTSKDLSQNRYRSVADAIAHLEPSQPLYALYPQRVMDTAKDFMQAFSGTTLYAVKTNTDPIMLKALSAAGMKTFDVASLQEIRDVRKVLPRADLYFMHPVKSPEAIREAYFGHDVRRFVLDSEDELYKILRSTDLAQDLELFVRIALPKNEAAQIDFSSKFGAAKDEAIELLKKCRSISSKLGLSFHVGTQTIETQKYALAVSYASTILRESKIDIDVLNVGGGFPVRYLDDVCSLEDCFDTIDKALKNEGLDHIPLIAEPGRCLVAQGADLIARVELRKGKLLYINDGVYGGLFDASNWLGLRYPVRAVSCDSAFSGETMPFKLAGPTCDSLDMMDGPFVLPSDIGMGDWVIFENAGAYSQSLRGNFNGFGDADTVCIYESRDSKSS